MMDLMQGIDHKGPYFAMLIGLPGVGKSTFRKGIGADAFVLSTDDHIEELAKFQGRTYNDMWQDNIKDAESAMWIEFEDAVLRARNIILDRTNLSTKQRKRWLSQVPDAYFKVALVFETPDAEEHARRLNRPGKTIPASVLESMRNNFQMPELDEGWDLIRKVAA